MWTELCRHCETLQLLCLGRQTKVTNVDDGVIVVTWPCPGCHGENMLLTGNAVITEGAGR